MPNRMVAAFLSMTMTQVIRHTMNIKLLQAMDVVLKKQLLKKKSWLRQQELVQLFA